MSADAGDAARHRPYVLAGVEQSEAPDGAKGRWYRYVLDNGRCTITGLRRGSAQTVADYATQYAEQLNLRGVTGQSAWTPRGRKPAP